MAVVTAVFIRPYLFAPKKEDTTKSLGIAVHLNDDERELVRGLIRDGIEVEVRQVAKDKKLVISESDL